MLIFDSNSTPILIESIFAPTLTEYMWVLDFNLMDFTLSPLLVLEEIIAPTLLIEVEGFRFHVPASWNILIYDRETSQLDVIEIAKASGNEFTALVYGPKRGTILPGPITILDYLFEYTNVAPSLHKHQMLCHPIGPNEWVSISPSDSYNKYLRGANVGDLIG